MNARDASPGRVSAWVIGPALAIMGVGTVLIMMSLWTGRIIFVGIGIAIGAVGCGLLVGGLWDHRETL